MGARHTDEVRAEAQRLMEAGQTLTEVSRATGLSLTTISEWAKAEGWQVTEVIRQVRIQEQRISVDPALDMLVKRMEGLTKADREAEYDDAMHKLACSIPLVLRQLSHQDIVTKADKVAKLVELSRSILDRGQGNKRQAPLLSLGLLSAGHLPDRMMKTLQLPEQ